MFRWLCVSAFLLNSACDQQPSTQELEKRIGLLEAENNRLQQTADRADAASATYDACISDAFSTYNRRWNGSCAGLRKDALRQRASCKASGRDNETCLSIEVPAAQDCALPTDMADRYDAGYKDDQRLCLGRLNVEH